jgi:hypothetical protein
MRITFKISQMISNSVSVSVSRTVSQYDFPFSKFSNVVDDSPISTVSRLWEADQGIEIRFSAGSMDLSLLQSVPITTGAHPAFYPVPAF